MIATSGLASAIHSFDLSKPENPRFQYGSSVCLLSIAAPIAGTWDDATPAMILATIETSQRFDLDLDFADLAALALAGFALVAFFAGFAAFGLPCSPSTLPAALLPVRLRLPSTERPPLIIMSA